MEAKDLTHHYPHKNHDHRWLQRHHAHQNPVISDFLTNYFHALTLYWWCDNILKLVHDILTKIWLSLYLIINKMHKIPAAIWTQFELLY